MKVYQSAASLMLLLGASSAQDFTGNNLRGAFDAMKAAAKAKYADVNDIADFSPASTFGTTLFSTVSANFPDGNVLISPLSVHKSLAMVKDGATIGSDNLAEMKQVLGTSSSIDPSNDDPGVQLTIANSVWANDLRPSFIETIKKDHNGEAKPLPDRYTTINDWVEDNTNGMIRDLLPDEKIPSDVVALLVNAVFFKAAWTYEFDPEDTIDGDFNLRDESTLPARFMTATRSMGYIHQSEALGGASAVVLDYGERTGDDEPTEFTSLFILPSASSDGMKDVIAGFGSQPILDLLDKEAYNTNVNLQLPRFKLEFGTESLKDTLQDMGIEIAFDQSNGKFEEMSKDPTVYLGDVFHKAVIEVTEKGTEAAASTASEMRNRSARPQLPPQIIFDRPFVVVIVHRPTGEPVFMGRVEEPELDFD